LDGTDSSPKQLTEIKRLANAIPCPVQRSQWFLKEFLADFMCGRCFLCAFGVYEIQGRIELIAAGKGTETDIALVKGIAQDMVLGSLCKKGRDAGRFMLEWVDAEGFCDHIKGRCAALACPAFFEYVIVADKCISCGLCKKVCKHRAILGKKKTNAWETGHLPFEIAAKRCAKSGACKEVCPTGAIILQERLATATANRSANVTRGDP
jgi:NADH-quinone oxidoreductase subunit F